MRNKYLLFLVIAILTIQCRKDRRLLFCEEFPQDCVDIFTVKDHFFFDVGTYWVYQEETSGQLDSQWVSQANTYSNVCWFDYRIRSSITSHYFDISTILLTSAIDSGLVDKKVVNVYVSRSKTKPGGFIGSSKIASFPYIEKTYIYNSGGELTLSAILNDYKLGGKTFLDVKEFSEQRNISENKQPTLHYYAKNIGLIRKKLIDSSEVWSLIRYNIVQ
ncbi:MAG: hypothetical protein AB8B74_05495 [Crocinitomicaceae bacterium]